MAGAGRRIGIMGGTFDPIHHAHLCTAAQAAAHLDLDEVVLIPAGVPWQKADQPVSPAADRYAMAVVAASSHPHTRVSRIEVDRPGPSYTVETLREYRWLHNRATELFLILGADAAAGLVTWREVDAVLRLARLAVCTRPGYRLDPEQLPGPRAITISASPPRMSSTAIRERARRAAPIRHLVPARVAAYIATRGLYRD